MDRILTLKSPLTLLLALGLCLVCITAFSWRGYVCDGAEFLDLRQPALSHPLQSYSVDEAEILFKTLEKIDKLSLYQITEVTLDLAFPVAYGILLTGILFGLIKYRRKLLLIPPILMALADMIENLSIFILIQKYFVTSDLAVHANLVSFASTMTSIKWIALFLTLILIVICALWRMYHFDTVVPKTGYTG